MSKITAIRNAGNRKQTETTQKKDRFEQAYEQGTAVYEQNRRALVQQTQQLQKSLSGLGSSSGMSWNQLNDLNRYYNNLHDLSLYGYDTSEQLKAIGGAARKSRDFLSQFKDEQEFNELYLYPTRYRGMGTLGLSKSLDKLRIGGKSTRAEYDWLKQHQYEFWTPEQLRRGIADTQKLIASEKKRGRNNLILKDQLSRMQNAAYSVELSGWNEQDLRNMEELARLSGKKTDVQNAGNAAQLMTPGVSNPWLSLRTAETASENDPRIRELTQHFRNMGYRDDQIASLSDYFLRNQHAQQRQKDMQELAEWANKNFGTKVLASALSVPLSMAGGLGYADLALKNATAGMDPITGGRKQVDQYSPMTGMSDASSVIRGSISEEMSPVGSFLYQTGMSILDSRAAMGSGNWVGEALLGGSAAMQATRAAYDRGATDWQALAAGAWAGTAETLFEHISLDKLRIMQSSSSAARRTAKQFLIDLAKQSGVEGSEEAFTTIANKLGDDIIMRDKSELNAAVRAYMEQGMSEEEATKQAWKDWFGQLGLDALGGALSGGVNAGMSMGIGTMQYDAGNRTMGQQIQRTGNASQLVDMGKAMPEGSAGAALAGRINPENTGRRTARQLGELYTEVQRGNLANDVQARLEALGSENAAETARALVKQHEGLDLTKAEETLLDTKSARRVATEFSDALEGYEGSNDWAYAAADRQKQLHDSVFTAKEAERGATIEGFAEQYGEQAKAVEALYRNSQDLADFETSFDAAYTMGQNGASLEAAQRHNAVRGLEPEQVEIAWQMGKDAAHDNTTGGNSNGTEVHLRRGSERSDGARALGEVRGVAEAADRAQAGKKGKNRPADSQALKVSVGEKISALRLGVENGAVAQTVYTVTGNDTKSMKKARALAQEHGMKVVFFAGGNLGVHSRADKSGYIASARGLVQGDTVYVRVDHEQFTADQIMRHEMGHDDIAHGRVDQNAVRERIRAEFGEEQFDAIVDLYLQAYAETGMTADEIWEEIVCDAIGDMNIFSDTFEALKKKSAGQLLRATKQAANEMRGEHREQEGRAPPVEAKFSIQTLADGKKYVKVDVDQTRFDGLSEKEQRKLARRIIKKRYVGRVIGTIHQAYVNSRSADEYGHSANRRNVAADIKEAKMRVSTELENLMDVGTNYRTLPDGLYGHSHPRATGGYSYIDVLFEVGDTLYTGTINIENTNRGAVFKDLTQIRNATEGTSGSHEHSSSPTSQDDVSNKSISDSAGKSKQKLSYAGIGADTANYAALNEAERRIKSGEDADTVRRETGWFRGADGKWRFEIDDSKASFASLADAGLKRNSADYARYQDLMNKLLNGSLTAEEIAELRQLDPVWKNAAAELKYKLNSGGAVKLGDVLEHKELFEAYPELEDVKFAVVDIDDTSNGTYNPVSNTITLRKKVINNQKKLMDTLMHEVQHAIQEIEDFSRGENEEHYKRRVLSLDRRIENYNQLLEGEYSRIGLKDFIRDSLQRVKSGNQTMDEHFQAVQDFKDSSERAEKIRFFEESKQKLEEERHPIRDPYRAYLNTAGEIEARDTANRRGMSAEERRNTPPNIGDENTVFADRDGAPHLSQDLESIAELRRENRELRERARKWRRETTRTKAPELRREDVRSAARALISDMQSTVKAEDIEDDLKALGEYMMRGEGKRERTPSWTEIKERAGAIAEKLVDNAEALKEGSDPELYNNMRKYVRDTKMTIADRDKGDIPNGYEYFRRQNVGILRLGKDGLPVDTAYQQLQDEFGEDYFPAEITHPADQLMRIADVINGLKPAYENPHTYHRAEAVEWASNAIIDTLLSEDVRQTAPTFADRQAAKLDARVAAERDRADARVAAEREKAEARRKEYMQHSNAAIRRVRAQRDRQIARVKQEHRAQKERARERRTRSEMWHGILAMKKDFQRMAEKPEKGNSRHAPMGLAIALRNVADCFDRERGRRDGNVKLPEFKESLVKLRDEYESMKNDGALSFYFDPVVMERLAAVNLELRDVTDPTTLTTGQLGQIYDALRMCKHGITTANKFISMEYSKGIMEAGRQWGGEVMRASPLLKGVGGQLLNYQLRPDSFFARISGFAKGSVGEQVQQMFVGGTEKMLRIQQDFYYSFEKYSTDKRFDALTKRGKALVDVGLKDMDGNTVKLTRDQMLSVYMHLRAEDNLRAAAYGGLDVPNAKAYYTGNVAESFDKSVRTSCIDAAAIDLVREQRELERLAREDDARGEVRPEIAARLEEVQAELQAMEGEMIGTLLDVRAEIEKQMTDFEKELVETADAWMKKSADYINTETVAMYGIEKANVDHYWTIHRNTNFVNTDMRTAVDEINLENWGSLKERVRSHAPVKLTGFIFELDNHTKKMSQFCGFAAVQRDFNKLYNTRLPGQHSSLSEQVQKKFGSGEKKLGVSGQEYIDNYIKSISGGEHVKPSPIAWFRMNLPRATLSANFRVALSQVASVPTAAAEVGWGAMAKGFARYSVKGISAKQQEQLARTDPWFWQRSRGEGGMREFAEMKESTLAFDRAYNKVAGTKVGKAILNWCQRFDMYATYTQWAMAEEWVKSNRKDLQKGSDEFNEAVSRKYRDIIRKTQPNYTVTERSDLLRDSRETMKWATMYKTQSNQNLNILYDATARLRQYTRDFKAGKNGVTEADLKDARKQFSRAYTGVILGGTVTFVLFRAAANALMHCMNAYRDDDDELTWESFLDGLWQETLGATSGMFLLGSEIEEIIVAAVTGGKYWGLSDSAIGALSDVIEDSLKLLNKVRSGEASWTDYRKVIYSFMAPLGIPGENVAKIVNGVRYHIEDIMNGEFLSFEAGVNRTAKQQANRFLNALRDGDSSKMQRVFDEMIETSGAQDPEKTTRDALRKRIKSAYLGEEDGITISDGEAIKLLEAYGGKSGDDAADLLNEWKFEKEYGIKYSDLKDAYLSGELSETQYVNARMEYGGKSEEDAQTDARKLQCFIDYGVEYGEQSIVDAAVSGEISVEDARTIWMEYGGISEKEADSRVYQLQFVTEHPGTAYDDVKPSAVTGYYEYGQAAKIPAEDFMGYMTEIDGYHADVDANGNAVSGSKKQKVVNYINSLPISRDQKTALYLSCGYAASKVPSWT